MTGAEQDNNAAADNTYDPYGLSDPYVALAVRISSIVAEIEHIVYEKFPGIIVDPTLHGYGKGAPRHYSRGVELRIRFPLGKF